MGSTVIDCDRVSVRVFIVPLPPALLHLFNNILLQTKHYEHMHAVCIVYTMRRLESLYLFPSPFLAHTLWQRLVSQFKNFIQTIHTRRFSAGPVDATHIERMKHTNVHTRTQTHTHTQTQGDREASTHKRTTE